MKQYHTCTYAYDTFSSGDKPYGKYLASTARVSDSIAPPKRGEGLSRQQITPRFGMSLRTTREPITALLQLTGTPHNYYRAPRIMGY